MYCQLKNSATLMRDNDVKISDGNAMTKTNRLSTWLAFSGNSRKRAAR